jgi:exodeoxyribonuclease VII large subunit
MTTLFDLPFEDPEPEPQPQPPLDVRERPVREPGERRILTVSEVTADIRGVLESSFGEIWVEGEISNCRVWNTGHMFFSLKDDTAQIKAIMYRSAVRNLRFKTEDGLHVLARGRLSVYEPKGEYQLLCEQLEPQGVGARQVAFEQLKRKLQAEGLFAESRKRPLPALPRKIGIVTSLDGAALRDIINVLRRRYPNAHLVIRPTRVQGEGAADEIARAVRDIGRVSRVDVAIVGRGGGSVEDLWAFNDEAVARAIVASPVPIISAVGHEVDFTIADFVADLRAPTPSAAAEIVVSRKDEYCSYIERLSERLSAVMRSRVQQRRAAVHALVARRGFAAFTARLALRGRHAAELTHALRRTMSESLARGERRLGKLRLRLESRDLRRRLGAIAERLTASDGRMGAAIARRREAAVSDLRTLSGRLDALSPLAVLGRGYSVTWNADRTAIIRRVDEVKAGDRVNVTLHQGEIACDVVDTRVDSRRSTVDSPRTTDD